LENSEAQTEQVKYISLHNVGQELGVARGTVYYYIRQLDIQMKKFPLDRKAYIALEDLERIKAAKQAAAQGLR
jgi:hypothetical protein